MTEWIQVSETQLPADGTGIAVQVQEVSVAIFREADQWFAVENRCPHQGAALSGSSIESGTITCPLHGWKFQLEDGACMSRPSARLTRYAVRADDGNVFVSSTPIDGQASVAKTARELRNPCLVRYGSLGWVGLFESDSPVTASHRSAVVVRTDRGEEVGEFLNVVPKAAATQSPLGAVQREATADDILAQSTNRRRLPDLLKTAARIVSERNLNIDLIDAELLLNADLAVLYYLGEFAPDFAALRTELAIEHGLQRVDLVSLIEPEPTGGGCGSGGCGSGGCGSGGCGSESGGSGGCGSGGCDTH